MTTELNINQAVMSPRIGQGFDSSPEFGHTSGDVTKLQKFYPFRPLMMLYHLANLQIEIPYGGITGMNLARLLK